MEKVTQAMRDELRKPLPPAAISKHPSKTYLSSIKAIYVTERLNDVFGIGSWKLKTESIKEGDKGMIVVKVILEIPEYGIYLESFGGNDNGGENSKNFDLGDAYKGATTDGITKICSYLEIGIDVFKGLVTAPKQEEKKQTLSNDKHAEIMECDGLKELEEIWNSNKDLHDMKEYCSLVAKRKIEIIKKNGK